MAMAGLLSRKPTLKLSPNLVIVNKPFQEPPMVVLEIPSLTPNESKISL